MKELTTFMKGFCLFKFSIAETTQIKISFNYCM